MYKISTDTADIMQVETWGFWDIDTARAYMAELKQKLAILRGRYGRTLTLVDGRQVQIQSQDVMQEFLDFEKLITTGERDRAAYVVTNNLAKMQAQRLAKSDRLRVFVSPDDAMQWLAA